MYTNHPCSSLPGGPVNGRCIQAVRPPLHEVLIPRASSTRSGPIFYCFSSLFRLQSINGKCSCRLHHGRPATSLRGPLEPTTERFCITITALRVGFTIKYAGRREWSKDSCIFYELEVVRIRTLKYREYGSVKAMAGLRLHVCRQMHTRISRHPVSICRSKQPPDVKADVIDWGVLMTKTQHRRSS